MKDLFKNGKISEITYKGYSITMNEIECLVIRKEINGHLVLETSVNEDINWCKNYIDNILK